MGGRCGGHTHDARLVFLVLEALSRRAQLEPSHGEARVCGAALVACAARRDSGVVLEARAVARLARVLRLGAADLNAAAGEAVAGYAERLLAARKTAAPGEAGVMAVQT